KSGAQIMICESRQQSQGIKQVAFPYCIWSDDDLKRLEVKHKFLKRFESIYLQASYHDRILPMLGYKRYCSMGFSIILWRSTNTNSAMRFPSPAANLYSRTS